MATLGRHESDLTIAGGYLKVAEIAALHWIEHGPDDSLPLPILYNYRHAIELTLKWLVRLAASVLRHDGHTDEGFGPEKLDRKLAKTHNIQQLAELLDEYLGLMEIRPPDNRIDSASRRWLDWLYRQDRTGQGFRYAMVRLDKVLTAARPEQVTVNFYEQVNELHQVAKLLYDGYTGWLDDHEELRQDYYEWLRSDGATSSVDEHQHRS